MFLFMLKKQILIPPFIEIFLWMFRKQIFGFGYGLTIPEKAYMRWDYIRSAVDHGLHRYDVYTYFICYAHMGTPCTLGEGDCHVVWISRWKRPCGQVMFSYLCRCHRFLLLNDDLYNCPLVGLLVHGKFKMTDFFMVSHQHEKVYKIVHSQKAEAGRSRKKFALLLSHLYTNWEEIIPGVNRIFIQAEVAILWLGLN